MKRLFLIIACLLYSSSVMAQAASTEDIANARRLFRQGLSEARGEHWERAREYFERSFEIVPRDATLLNLARAEMETGHLVRARERFTQYLDSGGDQVDAARAAALRESITSLSERIVHLRIVLTGDVGSAEVRLQGRPVTLAELGMELLVDPGGVRVVIARVGGDVLTTRSLDLAPGARHELHFRVPARAVQSPTVEEPRAGSGSDDLVIGLGVAGAVLLAVAGAVGLGLVLSEGSGEPDYVTSGTIATFTLP